jgi:hypothetical protein
MGSVPSPLFPSCITHRRNADKLDVVKEILVNLSRDVEGWQELHNEVFRPSSIPIDHYFKKNRISSPVGLAILYIAFLLTGTEGHKHSSPTPLFVVLWDRGN